MLNRSYSVIMPFVAKDSGWGSLDAPTICQEQVSCDFICINIMSLLHLIWLLHCIELWLYCKCDTEFIMGQSEELAKSEKTSVGSYGAP